MQIVSIYVTCANRSEAHRIAEALVTERLAACVNILPAVTAVYRWQGRVRKSREVALICKTKKALLQKVIRRAKALHSYDVPCIVAWPIAGGTKEYVQWVGKETKSKA